MVPARRVSYWQVFRLIFVLFFLYLLGDAFYRWDGFRYYASFTDFLPSVALVTILWSIVAVFTSFLTWLLGRIVEWLCLRTGWRVKIEHWLLFLGSFLLLGLAVWIFRRSIWDIVHTYREILFFCITLTAIFIAWVFRNKSERLIGIIQERITPLVWLFGIWVVISIPLVAYHTWGKDSEDVISQTVSQTPLVDKERPNIILVTFDALTARDMSVHGYHRPTTPFITNWAKNASLFTRLEAESNATTPATSSLMTGKRIWTHQLFCLGDFTPLKSDIESLPLLLKNNGYFNMAFIVNHYASVETLGIENSFEIAPIPSEFSTPVSLYGWLDKLLYQLFGDKIRLHDWIIKGDFIMRRFLDAISRNYSKTIVPPERAFNKFIAVIDGGIPEPFFAWIHLFPPHHPYLPPEPFIGMFNSSSELRTLRDQWKLVAQHFPPEMQPTIDTLRARYDEFIRYSDKYFEDFITKLTARDKLKNTVVILSSDHGESFEHNYLGHSRRHLYEQLTHIPLIIREPGQSEGRVINDLVEQIDIAPTILEIANIPVPLWMEGRSLVPLMRGKRVPPRPAFSMALQKNPSRGHKITRGTIAVREGDYKLIHYLEEKKSLLFNLKEDPEELNNLFNKEPEVGHRLLSLIQDNLKRVNEKIRRGE